jgi:hypothetical protein
VKKLSKARVRPANDDNLILLGTATLGLWIAKRRQERAEVLAAFAGKPLPDPLLKALRRLGWVARYREGELSRDERLTLLDAIRDDSRAWLRGEAEKAMGEDARFALGSGLKSSIAGFFGKAKSYLREAFLAATLALTGPDSPDNLSAAYLESQIRVQLTYLDRFEAETNTGTQPLDGTFPARAELYGGALWQVAENVARVRTISSEAVTEEKRVLGPSDAHCSTCVSEANKGWKPVGTLRPLGDSECKANCRCTYKFR